MRWKDEPTLIGARQRSKGFLLFPKTIGTETRWLERAEWVEEYQADAILIHGDPLGDGPHHVDGWVAVKWL